MEVQSNIKLLTVLTESHRELFERYFLPSLPKGLDLLTHRMDSEGDGSYESGNWQAGVVEKLKFALNHVAGNKGSIFVLSDVDIQFFGSFTAEGLERFLNDSNCEILFQRETTDPKSYEVNTGFYIARCGDYVEELLRQAIKKCAGHGIANDQIAVNGLLKAEDKGSLWDFLPPTYYARSHGFPPPSGIVMHHANLTSTVSDKHLQMLAVRSYAEGGTVQRLRVILGEAVRYMRSGNFLCMIARRLRNLGTTKG